LPSDSTISTAPSPSSSSSIIFLAGSFILPSINNNFKRDKVFEDILIESVS